ncbi:MULTISPECIES: LacI family DNA-binding transcriptional regulator [unclassified Cryobacterium]|uniref:LacI family DNA-binding transcriptional regulator n=1 Tax=unclassified Cryobacterium TaxID=2649013 RepID=UPI00106D07DF|nr:MULTISPECIES: LacI family DNA-binding transcriptional regulator [unclassified Cryobacterium]TFC00782.1 LacI family transcriptional regulator [Cryobacterium sp. MDB2-A-1]TFC09257.1 LacI family transcriptional regulator [Cryobacterium sp. MDB2-33-2]TFC10328.1 LacI family transcriptional regulator [Cryobacterium sp. MDB2-A-2]TFC18086.1 LacI family transcriptional regulator [Cryobacterium sp. MDB2-10]TFC31779.1 LacI family transcriptional regulator [Cryobacterium sp. MDB1-18-2]
MTTQPRATLADVARLADVSSKTVSRVFSDGVVSAATRARVLAAAKQLRFRPNVLARSLRHGGVSNTVAFVIGDITNPFYFHVAAGIERALADNGLTMVLATTDDAADSEEGVVDALLAQRVRALVLIPVASDQSYLDGERQLGTPIVSVDRPASNLLADSVVLQNRDGMRDAVRSLISLGHRRIGFVSNPSEIYTVRERLAGYREALAEVGISDNTRYERCNDDPTVSAERAVASLFEQAEPPTALVTGNNRATAGAVRFLRGREPRVAFIGFDDFDLADALDISVVAYDTMEIGRAAAQLALDRLTDPTAFIRQIQIPTHLVHRGSGEIRPPV